MESEYAHAEAVVPTRSSGIREATTQLGYAADRFGKILATARDKLAPVLRDLDESRVAAMRDRIGTSPMAEELGTFVTSIEESLDALALILERVDL